MGMVDYRSKYIGYLYVDVWFDITSIQPDNGLFLLSLSVRMSVECFYRKHFQNKIMVTKVFILRRCNAGFGFRDAEGSAVRRRETTSDWAVVQTKENQDKMDHRIRVGIIVCKISPLGSTFFLHKSNTFPRTYIKLRITRTVMTRIIV